MLVKEKTECPPEPAIRVGIERPDSHSSPDAELLHERRFAGRRR
jgi:hypothetical protein